MDVAVSLLGCHKSRSNAMFWLNDIEILGQLVF